MGGIEGACFYIELMLLSKKKSFDKRLFFKMLHKVTMTMGKVGLNPQLDIIAWFTHIIM